MALSALYSKEGRPYAAIAREPTRRGVLSTTQRVQS